MAGPTETAATSANLPTTTFATAVPSESQRPEMSGGAHFAALDGYRAIAALMVVLTHVVTSTDRTSGWLGHVLGRFDFGVPLFFLMSGFLLYRPWARRALEGTPAPVLRRYALRRAARILPLYWVVVVATLALLPEIQPVPVRDWVIHLLGLQIYTASGALEGLSQTWSLCTEISFYVLLPLLGTIAVGRRTRTADQAWRRQLWFLGTMIGLSWAWTVYRFAFADGLPYQAQYWLPGFLDWFGVGMLLAVVQVRSTLPGRRPWLVRTLGELAQDRLTALVLAVAVFAVACTPIAGAYQFVPNTPWQNLIKHGLYLLAAGLFLLPGLLARPAGWTGWLTTPVPHRLGLISYGIFLWHLVLLRMLLPVLGIEVFDGHAFQLGVATIAATLVVAQVTFVLVERPAQRWAHRY